MSPSQADRAPARIEELFVAQARATPNAPAALFRGEVVSYGELLQTVEDLAADLVSWGVGPGVLVALCVDRTPTMLALVIAALRSGGAYLPLDHRYPAERLAFLLADSRASILVADRASPAWASFEGAVLKPEERRLICRKRGLQARSTAPAVGEIHIGGPALALGYLNAPELTAERFPVTQTGRMYRTGDLAVQRDGELHFAGRVDRQVKVRGFRVEPGEIEATLMRHHAIERALVVARERPSGVELVAFVESQGRPPPAEIRRWLGSLLPSHMVPAQVVVLCAFPLLVSGKVDYAALPEAGQCAATGAVGASRVERAIIHVFEEVLGRTGLGPEDSFFELGGDSLASLRAALRLEELLGREVPAGLLHQASTARAVASALAGRQADTHLSLLQAGGAAPPLFCLADLFGQPFNYLSLARALAPERTIYGLAPGPLEAAFTADGDIDALTGAFAAEVRRVWTGPYFIAGYSAGGLLAACLAAALERDGSEVRLVLLDSTLYSRRLTGRGVARWALRQARALLTRRKPDRRGQLGLRLGRTLRLSRSAAPPAWIPRSQMAFASRMIRLGATYRPTPFSGPTLVVVADARDPVDALFDEDGLSGWTGVLTGDVTRASAPGGHHQFMREPNVIVTATAIRRFLTSDAAGTTRSDVQKLGRHP